MASGHSKGTIRYRAIFRKFGIWDVIFLVILVAALGGAFLFFAGMGRHSKGDMVLVTIDGKEYGRYPLDQDQRVSITNAQGKETNLLEIRDGKARMLEADCPDGLCTRQNTISREHENIVCLPNRVVAEIVCSDSGKSAPDGVDAIVK